MAKQTKFAAIVTSFLSDSSEFSQNAPYFWPSFFLLKPEFALVQTVLAGHYSLTRLRLLLATCLTTIKANDSGDKTSLMRRANASYLLVQIFESLWPRLRIGTFGVDAINLLCGLGDAPGFFDVLFNSILARRESEPSLVLLSLLSATRDIETNALVDFFIAHCDALTKYCLVASDLHILLLSLLLQLDRPAGPFVQAFKIKQKESKQDQQKSRDEPRESDSKPGDLNVLISNLFARCCQLYVCCRPQSQSFLRKANSRPQSAKLGLFLPTAFSLPVYFALFEPIVDASILCFHDLNFEYDDSTLLSAALSLLSYVVTSPTTPHGGDRLRMFLIAFEFRFAANPACAAHPFEWQQFHSCFNSELTECRQCPIGAMALDIISSLLELPKSILPVSHIIGRIIYMIVSVFVTHGGRHGVDWAQLFRRLLGFCNRTHRLPCEYNGYALATVALASSYIGAIYVQEDGYFHLLQALARDSIIGICEYRPPDAFPRSSEFTEKCKAHIQKLIEAVSVIPDFAEMQVEQAKAAWKDTQLDPVPQEEFPAMDPLSERPTFAQFFHVFERQHCENVQAMLHYAASHI
jgi:hypothetical protein